MNGTDYDALVVAGLDRSYDRAKKAGRISVDLATAKVIVFSDLHRGNRRRSDDFLPCEITFRDALAHYRTQGYTLILLGDAEDLWKYSPREVKKAHLQSLSLERDFSTSGRYVRIVGNHDDVWRDPRQFRRYLGDVVGRVDPLDGLCLSLRQGDEVLGTVFLTHGHQGTLDSDKFSWFSRLVLRYLYRPFQQLTGHRTTTPSTSIELRDQHSRAMYQWSLTLRGEKAILVAGHTHMPVFLSLNHVEQLLVSRANLVQSLVQQGLHGDVDQAVLDERVLNLQADIDKVQGKMGGELPSAGTALLKKPCYFNTGCCSFSDGDITGIEIEGADISLVRWKHERDGTAKTVRAHSNLVEDVFGRL